MMQFRCNISGTLLMMISLCLVVPAPRADAQDNPPRNPPPPESSPPEKQQPPTAQQGESSSKDSQIDFNAAPHAKEPPPSSKDADDGTFRPYDPHRAAKDVEVGNYYLKLKNYRAALERFNDALLYKPKDAEATYSLAMTQEKLDLLSPAYQNYQEYLKILPNGPRASDAREAIKKIGPHLDMRGDPGNRQAEHDIEIGETYLSMNNFAAAHERFEEAVRLAPENPVASFRLAQSLKGLQQLEPARLYYQKYLELDPHGRFVSDAKKAIADITFIVGK
jgi:tetratricopeptide (TPR) repeat protein